MPDPILQALLFSRGSEITRFSLCLSRVWSEVAALAQISWFMHVKAIVKLNTNHQQLQLNGYLGVGTGALNNYAFRNEALYSGSLGRFQDGRTRAREVSRRLGVRHCVIQRPVAHFQTTRNIDERPRSGRPRCINQRDDLYLQLLTLRIRTIIRRALIGNFRAVAM